MHWNFGTFWYSCFMLAGIYSSHCNALELWNLLLLMFYAGRYILQSLQCIGTFCYSWFILAGIYTLVPAMHWNFGTFWYSCFMLAGIYSSRCNALELWNLLHSCFMLAGIYSSHCNALELWNLLVLMFYAGRYILQSLQCIGTLEPSGTHVLCWQVYTLVTAMHWNFGTFCYSWFMLAGIYSSHCNALELWNLLLLMFYAGRYIYCSHCNALELWNLLVLMLYVDW